MGARGPAPKPTAVKMKQGNPGRRPPPEREPQPARGKPNCPGRLPSGAKRIFRELVRHLDGQMEILTRCEPALPMLALALHRWWEAEAAIEEHGMVMTLYTKGGDEYYQQRPEVSIAKSYFEQALKIADRYGLTPSARSRVQALGEAKKDRVAAFLFGAGADETSDTCEVAAN